MKRSVAGCLAVSAFALLSASCDWVQDRFRSCRHLRVDLVNSQQNVGGAVHIAADEELISDATLVAESASRQLVLCVERGDRKGFRAVRDGQTLARATCVAFKADWEYEASVARVVWGPLGFDCQNW